MAGSIFLAMTAAELRGADSLPHQAAYMACHFSPYGRGLSNIPSSLPEGSMLILNDRIPICGHDAVLITEQLEEAVDTLKCACLLLDLQRPGSEETRQVCRAIAQRLNCPVGISETYAGDLPGAVFLPPLPPCQALAEYLAPWSGREIWLEVGVESWKITVDKDGSNIQPLPYRAPPDDAFADEALHCRYHQKVLHDRVEFFIYRAGEDTEALLQDARSLGVTKAVGLWQHWKHA